MGSNPIESSCYDKATYDLEKCQANMLIMDDFIWGTSIFVRTNIYKKYLLEIVEKIRYAEDLSFRLMLFNGIQIVYYNKDVAYYSYGTGISTSGKSKLNKIVSYEVSEVLPEIINKRNADTKIQKEIQAYYRNKDIYKEEINELRKKYSLYKGTKSSRSNNK